MRILLKIPNQDLISFLFHVESFGTLGIADSIDHESLAALCEYIRDTKLTQNCLLSIDDLYKSVALNQMKHYL